MSVAEVLQRSEIDRPHLAVEDSAAVVIPCLNERSHIKALIDRILDDPDWKNPLVIVADGGSTDGTLDILSRICRSDPRVRVIANPRRLQSVGVNAAARALRSDRRWLVRVDAHADYPKGYVSSLLSEARKVGSDAVVVAMETRGQGAFQAATAIAQNSVLGAGGAAHRTPGGPAGFVDHGHHALIDLQRFLSLGGYDESFSQNEDAEFDVRLARSGGKIWLTREVEIVYYPRSSPGALFRQYVGYGRGRVRTLLKHKARPKLRQLAPVAVLPAIVALPFAPLVPVAGAPALTWAAICLAYGVLLSIRRRRPEAILSGPAAMIMHLAWSTGFWRGLGEAAIAKIKGGDSLAGEKAPAP